jgi:uncharacterized repeat protein (TIGR03803 family)
MAAPIQGTDGYFYGTTWGGGSGGYGTVFRVTTNGALTTLASFYNTNGAVPQAGLTLGTDGNFYGTTTGYYNSGGYGSVFRVTANGALTTLVYFGGTNGANPAAAALTLGTDGSFYGTTSKGGSSYVPNLGAMGYGTVFRVTTNGALTTLYSFAG